MSEHLKAKRWRERFNLSRDQLAELTGYSAVSIWWYERGETPPDSSGHRYAVDPNVWRRYRLCCAAVAHQLQESFTW
jgi:DNA-binding XRE family transcriptional regulator